MSHTESRAPLQYVGIMLAPTEVAAADQIRTGPNGAVSRSSFLRCLIVEGLARRAAPAQLRAKAVPSAKT